MTPSPSPPPSPQRFSVRSEPIIVDSLSSEEPDPGWTAVDSHGHRHYAVPDPATATTALDYPTLTRVITDPYYCPDCRDEHTDVYYVCTRCRERVEPGYRHGRLGPTVIPGPVYYFIDDRAVSPGEFAEAAQAAGVQLFIRDEDEDEESSP